MSVALSDVLRTTGASGQRKGLEPYAKRIVSLTEFKIERKGRDKDREGNPKEQRRVLTAKVETEGLKPRRARIPVRIAQRFIEAMDLRAEDAEPFAVRDVYVRVGEHGATLHDPNDVPQSEGGWKTPEAEQPQNGEVKRRGRPRRNQPAEEREPVGSAA